MNATATITATKPLTAAEVASVYSGKDGRCCCGCSGRHYANPAHRDEVAERRGYPVSEDECSTKMVNKVVKIINSADAFDVEDGGDHIAVVIGSRLYIAYLAKMTPAEAATPIIELPNGLLFDRRVM